MKNNFTRLVLCIAVCLSASEFLLSCVKDHVVTPGVGTPGVEQIRVPAEWEEQESVWMAWPTYDNKHDWSAQAAYAQIIKGLVGASNVDLCVPDEATAAEAKAYLGSNGVPQSALADKIRFHVTEYADIWLRDTGPIFIEKNGHTETVDFKFDGWGWGLSFIQDQAYHDGILLDETLDKQISQKVNVPFTSSELIMEGGALEFNGKGTVLVSEDVVFQRNPTWTKSQVEAEFSRVLGTKKVIWLKGYLGNDAHPVINAPFAVPFGNTTQNVYTLLTTNGHTDEFVRFINSSTVLLAEPPSEQEAAHNPVAAQSRKAILETRQILTSSTDQDGSPITIIDFPEVKPLYVDLDGSDEMFILMSTLNFASVGKQNIDENGSFKGVLAASYLNCLVINGVVLVAQYAGLSADMATHDSEAIQKLQQAFPGKTVIGIDVRSINVGGGGIHCITRQMPRIQ
ncbi:agmatine deiminase [Dyadobacter soli]|uniref:Agmatine deiminase n=1 Tax=Dyadobacter soli TaxID=659014 RepID=A0A1G7VFY6_9BACT|nr:agmatine deiminase family protein [Dyadobacter soli]SDG57840.1 agmatine deiminase [Dyadobacter soli]